MQMHSRSGSASSGWLLSCMRGVMTTHLRTTRSTLSRSTPWLSSSASLSWEWQPRAR